MCVTWECVCKCVCIVDGTQSVTVKHSFTYAFESINEYNVKMNLPTLSFRSYYCYFFYSLLLYLCWFFFVVLLLFSACCLFSHGAGNNLKNGLNHKGNFNWRKWNELRPTPAHTCERTNCKKKTAPDRCVIATDRQRTNEREATNSLEVCTQCFFCLYFFFVRFVSFFVCIVNPIFAVLRSHSLLQPFQGHSITFVDDDDVVCI